MAAAWLVNDGTSGSELEIASTINRLVRSCLGISLTFSSRCSNTDVALNLKTLHITWQEKLVWKP